MARAIAWANHSEPPRAWYVAHSRAVMRMPRIVRGLLLRGRPPARRVSAGGVVVMVGKLKKLKKAGARHEQGAGGVGGAGRADDDDAGKLGHGADQLDRLGGVVGVDVEGRRHVLVLVGLAGAGRPWWVKSWRWRASAGRRCCELGAAGGRPAGWHRCRSSMPARGRRASRGRGGRRRCGRLRVVRLSAGGSWCGAWASPVFWPS